jgi:aminoglycoside phosphotransferase (APT) family kinase protein
MCVRLPRIEWATAAVEKEQQWLPSLAPHLPLAIPLPLAKGTPAEGYPWHWSICRWLPGENAIVERFADLRQAATALAQFVAAMQRIDTTGGPRPGAHNFGRGVPLAMRDADTRAAIAKLHDVLDTNAVTAAWDGTPTHLRGTVRQSGSMETSMPQPAGRPRPSKRRHRLRRLGRGPACDFVAAWTLFSHESESRDAFRAALSIDDASWARSRGWALSTGLIALPYYLDTNPVIVAMARRQVDEVLADRRRTC